MVSIMSVNIRPMNLFNLFIFLASVYPVLSWRSSRYGGFGELSDYPLARPHHHGMTENQMATTFRLAGSLSESQPNSPNPFNKYGLPRKRDDKLKRCGKVLVKFVMQVCDYCITPSNTKQVDVSSRRKRQAGDMDEITEACCKRPCSAADVSVFCCASQR